MSYVCELLKHSTDWISIVTKFKRLLHGHACLRGMFNIFFVAQQMLYANRYTYSSCIFLPLFRHQISQESPFSPSPAPIVTTLLAARRRRNWVLYFM